MNKKSQSHKVTGSQVAYFDLIGGASGDMLLSALLEAGFKKSSLDSLISHLAIGGVKISVSKAEAGHIKASKIKFLTKKNINLSFRQIKNLLTRAKISNTVREKALGTYNCLRRIEEKVHGYSHRDFKFQHLGEIDAIIEITSFWQALEELEIKESFCSYFPLGSTSPATMQLLKGKKVRFVDWGYETVTPTAAALLRDFPQAELEIIPQIAGYGAGECSKAGRPDFLRIVIGEKIKVQEEIIKLEVNLDDINPQVFDHVMDLLFQAHALDVYITPIIMKKNRPAFTLSVLLNRKDLGKIEEIIFKETTTFGVRYAEFKKDKLKYSFVGKKTPFGKVQFRKGRLNGRLIKESPEYNDCKRIACKYNIPLIEVYKRLSS